MRPRPRHGLPGQFIRTAFIGVTATALIGGLGISSAFASNVAVYEGTDPVVESTESIPPSSTQEVGSIGTNAGFAEPDATPTANEPTTGPGEAETVPAPAESGPGIDAAGSSVSAAQFGRLSTCRIGWVVPALCWKLTLQQTYDINHLVQHSRTARIAASYLCGRIPHPVAVAACIAYVNFKFWEVKRSMQQIADRQMCAEVRVALPPGSILLSRVTAARC